MELIFFTAPHVVLCFRFVTETMLITHCFSYCWGVFAQHQGLLLFIPLPPQFIHWRCTRGWEWTARQMTQTAMILQEHLTFSPFLPHGNTQHNPRVLFYLTFPRWYHFLTLLKPTTFLLFLPLVMPTASTPIVRIILTAVAASPSAMIRSDRRETVLPVYTNTAGHTWMWHQFLVATVFCLVL